MTRFALLVSVFALLLGLGSAAFAQTAPPKRPYSLAIASLSSNPSSTSTPWMKESRTTLHTFQRAGQFPGEFLPQEAVETVEGSEAVLVRTDEGVAVTIETHGLPVDDATGLGTYSVWMVVFNYPELCSDACGPDDLPFLGGDPAIEANVMNVGGNLVRDGVGVFSGFLPVDDTSTAVAPDGAPLVNPRGADIHFILRYHGPPMERHIAEQLSTVWGACDEQHEGTMAVGEGFICFDPQAGAFPRPWQRYDHRRGR